MARKIKMLFKVPPAAQSWLLVCILLFSLVYFVLEDNFHLSPLWALEASSSIPSQDNSSPILSDSQSPALLDIDYRDVDIKEVARAFSEISGVNIIVSDEASAMITLKMSGVDWRTALEVISDTYNLGLIEKDNFIIITSLERRRMQEESGILETKIVRLNFVSVADIKGTLQDIATSRGRINVDSRTNSLIITDIKERLRRVEDVALQLDIRTPQVLIETMVIDVKLTDAFKWGVEHTLANHIICTDEACEDPQHKWTGATNVLNVSGGSTFQWSKTIFKKLDLNATLQSIITNTQAKILANPRIVTLDNLSAEIDIVTQRPYQEVQDTSGGGSLTSTSFLDIGIKLTVTPHITKDNFISMEVETEYSADTGADPVGGVPIVDERKASTTVLVKDGETIVMGGLRRRDVSDSMAKVPLLGDIPLLGNLFRKKDTSVTETELVIFVTPHLIGEGGLTEYEKIQLEEVKNIGDLSMELISFEDKQLLPLRAPTIKK